MSSLAIINWIPTQSIDKFIWDPYQSDVEKCYGTLIYSDGTQVTCYIDGIDFAILLRNGNIVNKHKIKPNKNSSPGEVLT